MKEQPGTLPDDANHEISLLVDRLRATEQRLQELTGGSVDSVLAPGGQSYMLQEAQEQLRLSEERFRGMFEAAAIGIAISTPDGRFLQTNEAYCRMLGYTGDELRDRNFASITHPQDLALNLELRNGVLAGQRDRFVMEKRYLKKNGDIIWTRVSISAAHASGGEITALIVMAEDITERRRVEARFRRLMDSDAQGVFLWNTKGEITGGNDAFLGIVGYTRDDLEAGTMSWTAMTPPEDAGHDQRKLLEAVARGACQPYEKEYIRKDGSRVPILIGAATFEDDPTEGVSFVVDLTERKKLEQRFRQSQKMEAIGQLTGGIAHDFNNLLGIIQLNLELIRERLSQDPFADDMAVMALRAAGRGASLTHQLLAYARQQPLEPKIVNIGTLLAGMASLLARTLGESIAIKTLVPDGLWTVVADAHQLENAVLNLAVNSLHAMPDGGSLIIEASNTVLDEIYSALNPEVAPGEYVTIAVADTGAGMTPETLERVLEPFFTTKPVGKGSGLGLSMVHGFAQQSGGHLKIYSEVGVGTAVNLYLPRASNDARSTPAVQQQQQDAAASVAGEVILVVEDDPNMRGLTLLVLNGLGYRTIEAEDGPAACALLNQADHIDLLLTDVVLPKGMNGPGVAKHARSRRPGIKVLFMSGYPRDAILRDGMLDDNIHLLLKPFPKVELARMVRRVLDERSQT